MGGCGLFFKCARHRTGAIKTRAWTLEGYSMNPLNNHRHSLILGIVLAILLALGIGGMHFNQLGFARWFHIVSGVFWIGLLYYFNVAQTPAMADAAADKGGPGGAAINKYVDPRALFCFP